MAVTFDGATYLSMASLACTDSTNFSFSVWTRNPSQVSTGWIFEVDPASTTPDGCTIDGNGFDLFLDDGTGTNGVECSQWCKNDGYYHHFLFSADTSAGVAILKIDGVSALTLDLNSYGSYPFTSKFNGLPFYVGSNASQYFLGDMDYLWVAPNVSLITAGDIANTTILKFRSQIGIQGVPTDPSLYPSLGSVLLYGNAAAFSTNHGSGGTLAVTGTLTDAAITPTNQTFTRTWKTVLYPASILPATPQIAVPADWTATGAQIHAIGGGQSGATSHSGAAGTGSDDGGDGADYAALQSPAFSPGDVLDVQIAALTAGGGTVGADTWLKNTSGSTVLLARGGASATASSVGDITASGGAAVSATGGDYDGTALVNNVPYTVRPAPYAVSGSTTFGAYTNGGGGGGGGAGGPNGDGNDSGDLRPLYVYQSNDLTMTSVFCVGPMGAAGGTSDGGQVSGGTYSLANGLTHADGNPLVPGDAGDPLGSTASGYQGDLGGDLWPVHGPTYTIGARSGGGGGPYRKNRSAGNTNAGHDGFAGGNWTDTDQNPNLPSFFAGPGGGGGGAGLTNPVGSTAGGGLGGWYGGGGGGGSSGAGIGAPGIIVLQYWTPGTNVSARTRIWGNYQ